MSVATLIHWDVGVKQQQQYVRELSTMFCARSHRGRAVKVTLIVIPYKRDYKGPISVTQTGFSYISNTVIIYSVSDTKKKGKSEKNQSDWGLRPGPIVGVPLLWAVGALGKSEQRGEGAVVWCCLPAREHGFLLRPVRMRRVALVGWALPLVAGLGQGVERRQGRELRQVAFVEFISILRVGREAGKEVICQTYDFQRADEDVDARLLPSWPLWECSLIEPSQLIRCRQIHWQWPFGVKLYTLE